MKPESSTIITQSTKESTIQQSEKISSLNNNESFKVYIRIRPFIQKVVPTSKSSFIKSTASPRNSIKKTTLEKNMIKVDKNILYLEDVKNNKNINNKTFIFDNIFNESATNEAVFNGAIKSMIDKILKGYNSTTLAYGVTGTGKTYTIFGDLSNNFKDEGIIFKACDYLFEKIELNKKINKIDNINYEIKVSYIEIYNEIVKDLINENCPSLMIVEDAQKGVICSNVKEVKINDSVQLKKIINESNKRRTMASTDQNQFSSRSHAILQMSLEKKIKKSEENYDIIYSKYLVVDLAGSEKSMERGKRREEGVNINKSLFTLGNCINILSEKSNTGKFVPYRDSKLTRILKDSLGGNILTVMLACISPCSSTYDETLGTLNYAFRAKKITKKVMKNIQEINVNNLQYKEMIDNLKNEIMQLKQIIKNQDIKLKEKVDMNNNKENRELNFDINSNKEDVNYEKLESFIINNSMDQDIKFYDNNQKVKIITERNDIVNNVEIISMDLDIYNKYIDDTINNDLNIDNLKYQIESIKKDKNILENYLLKENIEDANLINKYNTLKKIYDKYIEIVNEKLVENIEQNMLYNFNIKEITELNIANSNKVKELELQNETGEKNLKTNEEIEYIKKNIIENNIQKEQIYQNIQKNNEQKEQLKKLLLDLFENKVDYSSDKYIHIIHEKDKLSKITKQYKNEIDNYVKMQKQKEEDMMKITRKIEILRAKLKEKDRKIFELEKKGIKPKFGSINIKLFKNKNLEKKRGNEIKRNNSKFSKYKEMVKSPKYRTKNNSISSDLINSNNIENKKEKKYKSINNEKKLKIFLNNENNKITKKFQKNMKRNKTENKDKEVINNKINKSEKELTKYNELIIPTTTITLTENNLIENQDMKALYIKIPNKFKIRKTPNYQFKKIMPIGHLNSKISSKTSDNLELIPVNKKKNSVKSVKVDLQIYNNKLDKNHFLKTNSSDNKNKIIKNKIESNLTNVKEIKAEKIKIDLTKIDKSSEANITDRINKIKYLNLKTDIIQNNQIENNRIPNTKEIKLDKFIKIISKSNPKAGKHKKIINYNKKFSLKDARYENKLKYEQKNELINAESFINEYEKNKNNIIKDINKRNAEDKKSVNTESNIGTISEFDNKSSFIYNRRINNFKTYNETINSTFDNNYK